MDGRFYIQYKNHFHIKRNWNDIKVFKTVYLRENDFYALCVSIFNTVG